MSEWSSPPNAVWVWGKYDKYDETYCHSEEIKQEEFEIPITKYVRADIAAAAPDLLEALIGIVDRSHNGELGTSKVIDMRRIAERAIAKALGENK